MSVAGQRPLGEYQRWIEALLERRQQAGTFQRGDPLYRLHLTIDEFEELQGLVQAPLASQGELQLWPARAIVLYAAERLAREQDRAALAWDVADLDIERTNRWFETLMAAVCGYWKQPLSLSGRRRQLLVAIARAGGLPRWLFRRESSWLQRCLAHVLRQREMAAREMLTMDLVREAVGLIPVTYRSEDFMLPLLAELVDRVAVHRQGVASDSPEHNWHGALPVRRDDAAAASLVEQLAAQPRPDARQSAFRLVAAVRQHGDRWVVGRRLELDDRARLTRHEALFGGLRRGSLEIFSHDGFAAQVAELRLAADDEHMRIERCRSPRLGLTSQLRLRAIGGDLAIVGEAELPGAELPAETAWVFADDADRRLVGCASHRTARETLLVAAASEVRPDGEGSAVWPLGPVVDDDGRALAPARQLFRVRGRATVDSLESGTVSRYATGAQADSTTYSLASDCMVSLEGCQQILLFGAPGVVCRQLDGTVTRWRGRPEARPVNGGPWKPIHGELLGAHWLRVVVDGETKLLRKCLCVPETLTAQVNPDVGEVMLKGLPGVSVSSPDAGVESVSKGTDHWRIRGSQRADAPSTLHVVVEGASCGRFQLELPAPLRCEEVLGPDRKRVQAEAPIALDRLYGHLLRVRDVDSAAQLSLMARCQAVTGTGWTAIADLTHDCNDRSSWTLPLDRIKEEAALLLAMSGELDARVELRVQRLGGPIGRTLCQVQCFDTKLEPQRDGRGAPVAVAPVGRGHVTGVRLEARPVTAPDGAPVVAEPYEGAWLWPDNCGPGQWLLTAWQESFGEATLAARPLHVTVPAPSDAAATSTLVWTSDEPERRKQGLHQSHGGDCALAQAMRQAVAARRESEVKKAIKGILESPSPYDDLTLLWGCIDATEAMPATTFDAVRLLPAAPALIARLACQRAAEGEERLRTFATLVLRLDFAWWLLGPAAWRQGWESWRMQVEREREELSRHGLATPDLPARALKTFKECLGSGCRFDMVACLVRGDAEFGERPITQVELLAQHRIACLKETLERLGREAVERQPPTLPDGRPIRSLLDGPAARRADDAKLWLPEGADLARDVLQAPVVAALLAAEGKRPSPAGLLTLRRLRRRDEEFFDDVWQMTVTRLFHLERNHPLRQRTTP